MNPIVVPIAIVLLSAITYSQFLKPQFDVVVKQYDNLKAIETSLGTLKEVRSKVDKVISQYKLLQEEYTHELNLITQVIPEGNPVSVADFLIDLNNIMNESRMPRDATVSVGSVNDTGSVILLPVTITATVPFVVAKDFISLVQRWGRGVRVTDVYMQRTYSGDQETVTQQLISFRIQMEALFTR